MYNTLDIVEAATEWAFQYNTKAATKGEETRPEK